MFIELEKSLREENLPFYWDKDLNLYDDINSQHIWLMLQFVRSVGLQLRQAKSFLTVDLQEKIYKMFCKFY